jgi:hypothetical protein
MNDFQEGLLQVLVGVFGVGEDPTGYDIPYYAIVEAVRPWYAQNRWSVDEPHLHENLYALVDEGYLVTSSQIYRLTHRAIAHLPAPQMTNVEPDEEVFYAPEPEEPQPANRGYLIVLGFLILLGILYYYYGR